MTHISAKSPRHNLDLQGPRPQPRRCQGLAVGHRSILCQFAECCRPGRFRRIPATLLCLAVRAAHLVSTCPAQPSPASRRPERGQEVPGHLADPRPGRRAVCQKLGHAESSDRRESVLVTHHKRELGHRALCSSRPRPMAYCPSVPPMP